MSNSLLLELKMTKEKEKLEAIEKLTNEDFTNNIFYYRIHNLTEQLAIVNVLDSFLIQNPTVKLIVFDSVAFHFRMGFEDYSKRSKLLQGFAKSLSAIASQFDVSVVIMNQVTTKIEKDKSEFIPALGESWTHTCTHRIFLHMENNIRKAKLYKSNSMKESTIEYEVNLDGVRASKTQKRKREEDE
jgi:RAD51-like protein 2